MSPRGTIFALDLGGRAGFAVGAVGDVPYSATVVLKRPDEHRSVAFSNLICFLNEHWSEVKPGLVVKEAMLPLQAFRNLGNAEYTVRMTSGLHAVVEAMCVRFGIPFQDVADSTVRRHFIGHGRMGSRAESKAAVIQRCHLLGYMPKDCRDDNRADSLALWDYAAAIVPSKLYLFGETAA